MVTMIYMLGRVRGAGITLGLYFACLLFYAGICFMYRQNRSKTGLAVVFAAAVLSSLVCDVFWMITFFPDGEYYNHGLPGSILLLLVFPLMLIASSVAVTFVNRRLMVKNNKKIG